MIEMIDIKVKRIDKSLPLPTYQTAGACALDLSPRETQTIAPGEITLLPANLILQLPAGYGFFVLARSSLPRKKGLNIPQSVGLLDWDYCGPEDELFLQVMNFRDEPVTVERGERIAQGFILPTPRINWVEVETIEAKTRGGFGSTG